MNRSVLPEHGKSSSELTTIEYITNLHAIVLTVTLFAMSGFGAPGGGARAYKPTPYVCTDEGPIYIETDSSAAPNVALSHSTTMQNASTLSHPIYDVFEMEEERMTKCAESWPKAI